MAKLSIIIPVYNEERTISKVIENVKGKKIGNIQKEIIIVDDCSTDSTKNILKKIKDSSIKIFYHKNNMGKGAAIRTGLKNSTGGIILIQDADFEYNPDDYGKLLKPIIGKKAKVVYGSRLNALRKDMKNIYKLHYMGNLFGVLLA